jgi:hypothetical protein
MRFFSVFYSLTSEEDGGIFELSACNKFVLDVSSGGLL